MANRIDESKYEAMISALYQYATNVYTHASKMHTAAVIIKGALGEDDKGAQEAYRHVTQCQEKYADVTEMAKKIAKAMQEELDEQRKEDAIWNSTE